MSENAAQKPFGVSTVIDRLLSRRVLANLAEDERVELEEDLQLVRRLIGEQRTPRIAVVGSEDVAIPSVVKTILGESLDGDPTVKARLGRGRWYDYTSARGVLRLLDLSGEPGDAPKIQAVSREEPDLILLLWKPDDDAQVERLESVIEQAKAAWGNTPATVAAIVESGEDEFDPGRAESELRAALVASSIPNESFDVALRHEEQNLVDLLVRCAPLEVRVKLANLTWVREIKRDVAESVVRAASGIAGAIATVPIPVADILPLSALQLSMIASVAHISGRKLELRNAVEFVAAMSANAGVGFAARSAARTAVRFVPVAGSVIAAGIASTATYALGQGAIAYFIGERR